MNMFVTVAAVMFRIGMAFGHLVFLLIIIERDSYTPLIVVRVRQYPDEQCRIGSMLER